MDKDRSNPALKTAKELYEEAWYLNERKAYDQLVPICQELISRYPQSHYARSAKINFPIQVQPQGTPDVGLVKMNPSWHSNRWTNIFGFFSFVLTILILVPALSEWQSPRGFRIFVIFIFSVAMCAIGALIGHRIDSKAKQRLTTEPEKTDTEKMSS